MICLSLGLTDLSKCLEYCIIYDFIEIRLDLTNFGIHEIIGLLPFKNKIMMSYHLSNSLNEEYAFYLLEFSILNRFSYVDLDSRFNKTNQMKLISLAKENDVISILSHHDFEKTPSLEELIILLEYMEVAQSNLIKIACFAKSEIDIENMLKLYDFAEENKLIGFCMGEIGTQSRIDSLKLGAPIIYASIDVENNTAPSQFAYPELIQILGKLDEQ